MATHFTGFKGLGSAGELANWISALIAIARFCNLNASKKENKCKKKEKRKQSKAFVAQMLSRCAVIRNMTFCD